MKRRLALWGPFVITITIVIFSLFSFFRVRDDFIFQTENNLDYVYKYFENEIENSSHESFTFTTTHYEEITSKTINALSDINISDLRITILDMEGNVVVDSDFEPSEMNLHRSRPEVYAIISGEKEASAVRKSDTQGTEVLYRAYKLNEEDIIIRVSRTLDYLSYVKNSLMKYGAIAIVISISIFLILLHFIFKNDHEMIKSHQNDFSKLEQGDLSIRLRENRETGKELKKLSRSFNSAMEKIEQRYLDMERNLTWLEVLVQSLEEPLVVVNSDLNVIYTNRYARTLFNRHIDPQKNPYPFVLLTHAEVLDSLILEVLETKKTIRKEYTLQTAKENTAFQVIMSPMDVDYIIVLFHDLSLEYEARKLRSSFVANVTHELKTPLTSIRGFVETLRTNKNITTSEQAENFLEIIDVEAERLVRLIDDILRLSDIERLDVDYHISDFDLIELLDECLIQLDDRAMEKQISMIPNEEPTFLQVRANRDRVKQVFLNLLDNAIKYNKTGGKVWINIEKPGKYVYITVKDNGYGFSESASKRIFERFYRIDKSRSRELGGTGLGLSIVKHIAMLYDGEVSVKSIPNKSTTFTVKLKI
ncbi:MAG: GHKL domain-containing protein [Clostridiaceae bacterium]|nr:GHKL domain-containing protein [Clostridiaceae bacterium]